MSSITPSLQDAGDRSEMPDMLSFSLLGKPVVRLGDQEVSGFRTTKSLALLCYLAVHPQPHSRQQLTGLLWSDDPEEKAQNSLRVTLSNLNKLFPNHLEISRLTVGLRGDAPHRLDVVRFEQLTNSLGKGAGKEAGAQNQVDQAALEEAITLYRGDFLADIQVAGAPLFEEWLATQRIFYRERMVAALEALAQAQLAGHAYTAAAQTLERLLAQEPWHEAAYRQLMTIYSRMGDFNRALAYYERCRAMLAAELDVPPMPETEALHERIQAARRAVQYELPAEITPFVGREEELEQLSQMLAGPACRLITICGLGGMGKSRLALALARRAQGGQAQGFLNGVVWVSLAALASPESMPLALVSALRLPLSGQSVPQRQLLDFLQNKEMLLILDNFEHQGEAQIDLLEQILATCPDVKMLVTSWEPLNMTAEWRFDLGGLSFPRTSSDKLEESGAVQLFVQTARQVRPSFRLTNENAAHVRALCQTLGGIPLAIKLAAAWLRLMQVQDVAMEVERGLDLLATQMRDVPARQRSMRAIFEQTWDQLTPQEQRAMASLSIFRGGFRREAAEQMAGASLTTLTVLVDRSLLQVDGSGRYFFHELLRHFAAEKLAHDQEALARTQERHAHYYTGLLDRQSKPMRGHGQREAVALVATELDNIRVAWQHAVAHVDVAAIEKSVDVLIAFYDMRGWYSAGIDLLEEAVQRLQEQPSTPAIQLLIAKLCVHLGWAYIRLGQYEEATEATKRSQSIYQALNVPPPPGLGTEPLVGLGVLANIRGDHAEALRLGEEARRLSEMRGDGDNLQNAYAVLTGALFAQGDYAGAERMARHALYHATVADNQWFLAYILDDLGMIENALGNDEEAIQYFERSYHLRQEFDDPAGMALTSMHLAEIAMNRQRWEEARDRYERSLKSYYEINDRGGLAAAHEGLGRIAAAQGSDAEARHHFHIALQTAAQIGYMPLLLSIFTSVAEFLLATARSSLAITLLQRVQQMPAGSASTRQRAAHLLALHGGEAMASERVEGEAQMSQEELNALVTRLLVEVAIQQR